MYLILHKKQDFDHIRISTYFYLHYTKHHYRISIENRSYFLQFQTNLSETLHVEEVS